MDRGRCNQSNGSWTVYRHPVYRHPVYRHPVYRQPVYRRDRFIDSRFIDTTVLSTASLSTPSLIMIFLYKFIKFTRDFDLIRPNPSRPVLSLLRLGLVRLGQNIRVG